MNTGALLDLEIALRAVDEARAKLAAARTRVIHAHSLSPLPRLAIEAAGGLITADALCEVAAGILSTLTAPAPPQPAERLADFAS